jgi:peptidylprolyl isomerase
MQQAKKGDNVKVHYTGRLESGEVFDSSEGKEPLGFTVGDGSMIKGFDAAVDGLAIGEKRTVTIPCQEAYGVYNDEYIFEVGRDHLPEGMSPKPGDVLAMTDQTGEQHRVVVKSIDETKIQLDANHHLAGKDLVFDIELVEIK